MLAAAAHVAKQFYYKSTYEALLELDSSNNKHVQQKQCYDMVHILLGMNSCRNSKGKIHVR